MGSRYITDYETVAASQTDQVLGPNPSLAKQGDVIDKLIIIPANVNPGAVDISDGGDAPINVFVGGAGSLDEPRPFTLDLGLRSAAGSWQITTGADISVIAIGSFT